MNRKGVLEKRIPTLLGLVFILLGIVVTSILVQQGVIFEGRATPSHEPSEVRISNITESSFSVSYTTSEPATGIIAYGENGEHQKVAFDERDQGSGQTNSYKSHHITITNLEPDKTYTFSILSNDKEFFLNGAPYEVKTAQEIEGLPERKEPIVGKIVRPDAGLPVEAIVYVKTEDMQLISTYTKEDGSFVIPLTGVRTEDLIDYFFFTDNAVGNLTAIDNDSTSNIDFDFQKANPLPTITLSKNYDFTGETPLEKETGGPSLPSFTASEGAGQFSLLSPSEGQNFTDQQPTIEGTAIPNETVRVSIPSAGIEEEVFADASGSWSFRPSIPLPSGEHKVLATAGTSGTLEQTFTVLPSGSQIEESATPSATPTVGPVSPSPSPSPTNTPSLTPTISASATPSLTLPPTTLTPMPTVSPPGPPSGILVLGVAAFLGLFVGLTLFYLTRGNISV